VLTGANTHFGRTTELVKIAKPRPRVAAVINRITAWMAAVVLTKPGLDNMVSLVRIGRQVYERVATCMLSRLSRLFQNVIFVALTAIIFVLYVINALGMLLLLFMFDFVTLTQATDYVGWWSNRPAPWRWPPRPFHPSRRPLPASAPSPRGQLNGR